MNALIIRLCPASPAMILVIVVIVVFKQDRLFCALIYYEGLFIIIGICLPVHLFLINMLVISVSKTYQL